VTYVVREASGTPEDVEAIVQIGRLAYEDSRYDGHVFSEDRVRAVIEQMFREHPETVKVWFVVAKLRRPENAEARGCLLALAHNQIAVRGVSCNTPLFYVCPEARTTEVARHLIEAYRAWAEKQGAIDAMVHVTSGHRDAARVGQWLSRSGFDYIGDNFSKMI